MYSCSALQPKGFTELAQKKKTRCIGIWKAKSDGGRSHEWRKSRATPTVSGPTGGAFHPTCPDDSSADGRLRERMLRSFVSLRCRTSLASEREPCPQSAQCVPRRERMRQANSNEYLSIHPTEVHLKLQFQMPPMPTYLSPGHQCKKLIAFC